MSENLLDRKFRRRFELLDVTGDGFIDEADYHVMISRLCAATGVAEASPKGLAVKAGMLSWWEGVRDAADTDGDDRIDLLEYLATMRRSLVDQQDAFDRLGGPACRALIDAADDDGDGRVSQTRFAALMSGFGVEPQHSAELFPLLDTDGDGLIGVEEFEHAARDFFTSQDDTAVGNRLWGPH